MSIYKIMPFFLAIRYHRKDRKNYLLRFRKKKKELITAFDTHD